MSIRPVLTYDNPMLRLQAEEVKDTKSRFVRDLIRDMLDTMKHEDGIGLAAPQVGESLRIITIRPYKKTLVIMNPSIEISNHGIYLSTEGCLSAPGKKGLVERFMGVKVTGIDEDNVKMTYFFKGLASAVAQHEIDHLNGILYFDKVLGGYDLLENIKEV